MLSRRCPATSSSSSSRSACSPPPAAARRRSAIRARAARTAASAAIAVCDLSHRINAQGIPTPNGSGECTIESCGANTCPKEAECVKVYGSDFLTVACDPTREDRASLGDDPDCLEGVCPPRDDCQANEVCLPEGLCADEITARTSCRKRCKKDKDCRAGYECVSTGARGIYHAPDLDHPGEVDEIKICAPQSL